MQEGTNLFLLIGLFLIIGGATAYFAEQRGRNPFGWFLIGFFFGLFGMLLLFLLPSYKTPPQEPGAKPPPPPLSPAAKRSTLSEKEWYYLADDQTTLGPFSFTSLQQAWREGTLTPDHYVWCEGMSDWQTIANLPRLRDEL